MPELSAARQLADCPAPAQTYGALIYRLLGGDAEESFARSWGISYGMSAVTEWDDIVREALKGAVVLVLMERLFLTRNASWLEARCFRGVHERA